MPTSARRPLVRKQLSVTPDQDRALKRRSRELGVSEAEFVRRALDAALAPEDSTPRATTASPLSALLARSRDLAEGRALDVQFDRESLYEDRGSA